MPSILFILLLALVVFGPRRLPEIAAKILPAKRPWEQLKGLLTEPVSRQRLRLDEFARQILQAKHDVRKVVADTHKTYFGAEINDESLTAGDNSQIGSTRFDDWLLSSSSAN